MIKQTKFNVPQWLKEAARESGFIAAVVEFARQARYSKARFFEQLARGLYNRVKFKIDDHSITQPPGATTPPRKKKGRRRRRHLLVLAPLAALLFMALEACSGPKLVPADGTPCLPATSPGTLLDDDQHQWVRHDEQVRQYTVNPYRDPNNPNLRHDGHNVQRVEENAAWNLRPNPPLALAAGPAPARTVDATVLNPIKAELEQKLAEQQKYTALIIEQNEQLLLREQARQQQSVEVETLKAQTTDLQQQVGVLHEQLDAERELREQAEAAAKARPWWKFWQTSGGQ